MARKVTLSINLIGVDENILADEYKKHQDAYYHISNVMARDTYDNFDEGGFRLKSKKIHIAHFIVRCRTDKKALEELKVVDKRDEMVDLLYGNYKNRPSDEELIGKVMATAGSISKSISNGLIGRLGEEIVRNKTADVISLSIITEACVVKSLTNDVKFYGGETKSVADPDHPLIVILKNAVGAHIEKAMSKMHKSVEVRLSFQVSEPLSEEIFNKIESSLNEDEDDVTMVTDAEDKDAWVEYTDDLYYM